MNRNGLVAALLSASCWRVTFSDGDRTTGTGRLGKRQLLNVLNLVGNNGQPEGLYPLQKCQGDCDSDSDCDGNLICFQRDKNAIVPGCTGHTGTAAGRDYCIDPNDRDHPSLKVAGNNGAPAAAFPLGKCEGDCDVDSDCQIGLKCFQRDRGDSNKVLGCQGSLDSRDTNDYCYDPYDSSLSIQKPETHDPASTLDSLTKVGNDNNPSSVFPLSECQGDCDEDADCAGNLMCFQRDASIASIPGCLGKPLGNTDYCYDPGRAKEGQTRLVDTGVNWEPSSSYPLGLCEGDCDGDSDCVGDLVCHQTIGRLSVPSCIGRPTASTDYCIHPSDERARPPISGAFRLKKYWQRGFLWQEEQWEQEWCMECAGSDCNEGDEIFIRACTEDNTWFMHKDMVDGTTLFQIATTDLCLEWVDARDIRVRRCDTSVLRQKFKALNGEFGSSGKFEISTVRKEGCLTQHHHPKDGEKVFRSDCETSRVFDTSFWEQY